MYARFTKLVCRALALAFVASVSITLLAQDSAKPAKAPANDSASKWDIFLGYSYLAPKGTVNGYAYGAVNYATIASVARFFNKNVGVQFEGDTHVLLPESGGPASASQPNNDFSGGSGGLIARFPNGNMTLFVHALFGAEQVGSYADPEAWGPVITLGGGMDADTPWFNHRLAVRVFQADYQYTHESFGAQGSEGFNVARLSAGLVLHVGAIAPPPPVTLACAASPTSIFPGDPVTVTATAGSLDPKLNAVYSWSGSGVTGSGTTATVATGSLAAGSYTVKAEVKEGRPGKEGLRPGQTADCSASLTVKAYEPPTISCSASPSIINPGDKSAITATGVSPQNRPLTYSYSAASGTVIGSGATASFDSTGAAPGAIGINCNVTDDKGQTATAGTSVTITAPPPPGPSPEQVQLETRLALHSVFFPTAQPRVEHPEGGLVASQQGTLTTLATDFKKYLVFKPDAHLTLSGHADVRGSVEYNQALSERRVARTKQFLVEQGVPEGSIDTRGLGKEEELTADQVKDLVEQNPDLGAPEREKVLRNLSVIVLAQNRRVDVTLSTTGQQSVRLYPFNAADSVTLIDERNLATRKKAAAVKK
ncbi:MAG: OmpA family protein [Terracidiphilus sp.]|jgi:outer membrane protein OmpA-like peptidoglycan-associated protein